MDSIKHIDEGNRYDSSFSFLSLYPIEKYRFIKCRSVNSEMKSILVIIATLPKWN